MAEAFCKWDDEKTGLNPFLAPKLSCKGAGNILVKYVLGTVLLCIRLPFFVIGFVLLILFELLGCLVPGNTLKYIYWVCIISPLCQLLTSILGVFWIKDSYVESQKLRIRTVVDRTSVSIRDIGSNDIIISNCLGYVQVLLYAAIISDRFGFINKDGEVVECNLLSALRFCMYPSESLFSMAGKPLQSCKGHCPLILFAEGLPTNNRAVLQFVPLSTETYANLPSSIHLFALSVSSRYYPASYLVGGVMKHLLSLLSQLSLSVRITWLKDSDLQLLSPPQETVAKPKLGIQISRLNQKALATEVKEEPVLMNLEQQTKNNHYFYDEKYPELIASMLQTKVVQLGRKQGFDFIAYYNSRGNKKQDFRVC